MGPDLSIVQRVAAGRGDSVRLQTRPLGGARFVFSLPAPRGGLRRHLTQPERTVCYGPATKSLQTGGREFRCFMGVDGRQTTTTPKRRRHRAVARPWPAFPPNANPVVTASGKTRQI